MATLSIVPQTRIELAHEPPFRLGALEIVPALRQILRDGASETLEPRVMQVLVALAQAHGGIVSRDTLIDRCWDGRIVGDNAINRVISRLRHVAAGLGQGCFAIETVTKVGYRLTLARAEQVPASDHPASGQPGLSRRNLVLGAAGLGAAALAAVLLRPSAPRAEQGSAERLVQQGQEQLLGGDWDGLMQAIANFSQAVRLDPRSAAAWGALALAYAILVDSSNERQMSKVAGQSRVAAERALRLDPHNADAAVALGYAVPFRANWVRADATSRDLLRRFPDHWFVRSQAGELLADTGRFAEAIRFLDRLVAEDRYARDPRHALALALWGNGNLDRADRIWAETVRLWPSDTRSWRNRFFYFALSGRADRAITELQNDQRPMKLSLDPLDEFMTIAHALLAPAERDGAVDLMMKLRTHGRVQSAWAALFLVELGRADLAFDVFESYFLGRLIPGSSARKPLHPLASRETFHLFLPPSASLRADPRYVSLLERLGLEQYWRATGTLPDYRRL